MDAWRAVGGARVVMNLCDPRTQFGIGARLCARRSLEPRIIAAGGDGQRAAHRGNRMNGLVSPYECERRDGVAPVS